MARNVGTVLENNLTRGLITEATGLNFPDNAVTDADNVYFDPTGAVRRRKGIDLEGHADTLAYAVSDGVIKEFIWNSVSRTGGFTFLVVQRGSSVHFFEMTIESALSGSVSAISLDLNDFKAPGAPALHLTPVSFAAGAGWLFVCHPYCDPVIVRWNKDEDQFESAKITLTIRDFEGVEDGLKVAENPTELSDEHHYNLRNQGWNQSVRVGTVSNEIGQGGPLFEAEPPALDWMPLS